MRLIKIIIGKVYEISNYIDLENDELFVMSLKRSMGSNEF